MAWFWRTLLLVCILVAALMGWQLALERKHRADDQKELARLIAPTPLNAAADLADAEKTFGQAIVLLHKYSHEKTTRDYKGREIKGMRSFLDGVSSYMTCPEEERKLILDALSDGHEVLRAAGALETDLDRSGVAEGKWPINNNGHFMGERFRIGWHVSPVVVPKLRAHLGNFVLLPEPVWSMQDDTFSSQAMAHVQRYKAFGSFEAAEWTSIQQILADATSKLR